MFEWLQFLSSHIRFDIFLAYDENPAMKNYNFNTLYTEGIHFSDLRADNGNIHFPTSKKSLKSDIENFLLLNQNPEQLLIRLLSSVEDKKSPDET